MRTSCHLSVKDHLATEKAKSVSNRQQNIIISDSYWLLILSVDSFVCLGLFWEQAKEQAKSIRHRRLVMQTKLWICLQQRREKTTSVVERVWRTVWPCKSTRKQDETSASRFLRGKKKVRPHRSLWFIPFSCKFKSSYWVRKKGKRTPPDNSLKRNAAKRHKTQLSAIVQSQANIALRSNGKRWCLRF